MITQNIASKLANFQNNGKNNLPSRTYAPTEGTIFLSETSILASSTSYLPMVKKAKWFLDEKILNYSK